MNRKFYLYLLLFSVFIISCQEKNNQNSEEDLVLATLHKFEESILNNDKDLASKLLTDSAEILEYGDIENKDEYLSEHFFYDGRFLEAMNTEIESRKIKINNSVSWVSTKSNMTGNYNGVDQNLNFIELIILEKKEEDWKISAIHWSSSSNDN
ncbi:hypothetical protein BH23THE1_BH23THE1_22600 [soil metagenome]